MGWLRQRWIGLASEVSWRIPGRPVKILTRFSQAERGSLYDMLAAVEKTTRRELRLKYFRHAMDESRHAGVFLGRARALGGMDRTQAVIADAGYLTRNGIIGSETLFERLGERDFLAFVAVAEADAIEQFQIYLDRELPDPDTRDALSTILKDERFHASYSRAALDVYDPAAVKKSLSQVRWGRFKEGWLRFSVGMGGVVSAIWLSLIYLVLVGPFALLSRLEPGGWQTPRPIRAGGLPGARSQG